jgi:hypothetical protein
MSDLANHPQANFRRLGAKWNIASMDRRKKWNALDYNLGE